jgi:hypothetical protein
MQVVAEKRVDDARDGGLQPAQGFSLAIDVAALKRRAD